MSVGVEFADQRISVFFRGGREVGDKGLDQLTAGAAEGRGAAEVRGISFHEIGIEVVLADQKAELIAEPWLAIAISVGWNVRSDGEETAVGRGALENAPNSSTEQRPIP